MHESEIIGSHATQLPPFWLHIENDGGTWHSWFASQQPDGHDPAPHVHWPVQSQYWPASQAGFAPQRHSPPTHPEDV